MAALQKITPCLWYNGTAGEAVAFYTSVFPNSRITNRTWYGEAGKEIHGHEPGDVLTISFELDGQAFTALNGSPQFKFNEAVSLMITCETQEEIDHYWNALSAGGDPAAQQCGWLKDRWGLSWQVTPAALFRMLQDPDTAKSQRAFAAIMHMKKLDILALEKAFSG